FTSSAKKAFKDAFPKGIYSTIRSTEIHGPNRCFIALTGLQYKKPKPLLYGVDKNWVYQPGQGLHEKLRNELRMHYEYYLGGIVDKTFIPIYLFLSGAGTGRSRNAEEFYNTTLACLSDSKDLKLKESIRNALVFNVGFENGNSLRNGVEIEAYSAIGTRILKQLLPEKHLELIIAEYEAPLPWQMFELVAKYEEIEMNDATIFLIVDGLQNLMNSINYCNDQSSDFFRTLTNIHELALSGAFVITLCTATATNSFEVLKITHRRRVELPIASLDPPTICNNNNGRALEALQEILEKRDIKKVNVNDLMNDLRKSLRERYSEALQFSPSDCRAIEVAWPGLIRYKQIGETQSGYLIAPYIWIWILAQSSDGEDPSNLNPKRLPGAQFWQHFEHFVASFRTLKSRMVNDNEVTTIAKIHTGARLNSDFQFINHHLELEIAIHQEDTNSANYTGIKKEIKCDNGIVDVRKVHQYKKLKKILNETNFQKEREKSSSPMDFFLFYTTTKINYFSLPKNTGYVDKSNWVEYFGPYAGRTLTYAHVGSLDINNADKRDLELVEGVGPERADIIYNKRKFIDIDDAYNKTKIPKSVLKRFKF
ncbi:6839_t:CDS:2, partial [Funneliformis mosseae]